MAKKTKNTPKQPLVTSITSTVRKNLNSNRILTPEEIKEKKFDMLDIVDKALNQFSKNLKEGQVQLNSTLDLDRLIKLSLLLSGEPDAIVGTQETSETTINSELDISLSKIEKILDLEDEEVKAMYDRIYNGYNQLNDIDE